MCCSLRRPVDRWWWCGLCPTVDFIHVPTTTTTKTLSYLSSWVVTGCTWHTHTHTQPFYGSLDSVRDNPGELLLEQAFTHSHLSWSSIVPYLLHPSNTIHGIHPVQSMHLTVFFCNLSPSFRWSTSWPGTLHFILHTFLHPIIVFFSQHMPIPSQPV